MPPFPVGGLLTLEDYGTVYADGQDNAAAFQRAAAVMAQEPDAEVTLVLPAGDIRTSYVDYNRARKSFTLKGAGQGATTFGRHANATFHSPWYWNTPFLPRVGATFGDTGPLIQTAQPGATTVQLLDPADVSRLQLGKCLLHAGDIQGYGWPPNPLVWQYGSITAIDPSGLITLADPLEDEYRADFLDKPAANTSDSGWGRARIASLGGEGWGDYFSVQDLTLSDASIYYPGLEVYVARVSAADYTAPTFAQTIILEDYACPKIEGDKLIDDLTLRRTTLARLSECTGVKRLLIEDCAIEADGVSESVITQSARAATITGTSITMAPGSLLAVQNGGWVAGTVAIGGLTVNGAATHGYWRFPGGTAVAVESVGDDGEILWDAAGAQGYVPHQRLAPGHLLYLEDGSNWGYVARVHLYQGAATLMAAEHTLARLPEVGEVYRCLGMTGATDMGGNTIQPLSLLRNAPCLTMPGETLNLALTEADVRWRPGPLDTWDACLGWLDQISVTVMTPYSGVVATPRLRVRRNVAGGGMPITVLDVDLSQTGITLAAPAVFCSRLSLVGLNGGNQLDVADPADLPTLTIAVTLRGFGLQLP